MTNQDHERPDLFSRRYYSLIAPGCESAAKEVLRILFEAYRPTSVVDVGCGAGCWLLECQRCGIDDIHGVDGAYVHPDDLLIPESKITRADLDRPLALSRTFDLALCLEVAQFLDPDRSGGFVQDLTRLAPVIAFSSAIPFQPDGLERNPRWQGEWAEWFTREGFEVSGWLRNRVWHSEHVAYWYAQNLMLVARRATLDANPELARRFRDAAGQPLSVVHPTLHQRLHERRAPQ